MTTAIILTIAEVPNPTTGRTSSAEEFVTKTPGSFCVVVVTSIKTANCQESEIDFFILVQGHDKMVIFCNFELGPNLKKPYSPIG